MSNKKQIDAERTQAISKLQGLLSPSDVVYTILRRTAASGMSRDISLCVVLDGEIRDITYLVATALDARLAKRYDHAIRVPGCGMDAGFHIVYNLGRALYPEGGPLEQSPRKRQEEAAGRDRETDGGYLLRHRWL